MQKQKTPSIRTHKLFTPTMRYAKRVQANYERMGCAPTQNVRNPIPFYGAIIDVLPGSEAPKTKEEVVDLLRAAGYLVNCPGSVYSALRTLEKYKVVGSFPFRTYGKLGRPRVRFFQQNM